MVSITLRPTPLITRRDIWMLEGDSLNPEPYLDSVRHVVLTSRVQAPNSLGFKV